MPNTATALAESQAPTAEEHQANMERYHAALVLSQKFAEIQLMEDDENLVELMITIQTLMRLQDVARDLATA